MKRMTTIGLLVVALGAEAQEKPPEQPPAAGAQGGAGAQAGAGGTGVAAVAKKDDLAAQLRVWTTLSGSAAQIDACTDRYTAEFPDRKGEATISVKVVEGGRVQDATATTALQSSDRLTTCLSSVGRLWRFADGPFELSLPVPVVKGHKLRLKKPGEKDAPQPPAGQAPAAPQEDEGFIRFTPSWTE